MINQIFLIGYRATGKTTIGTILAHRLGFDFVDTDHLACQKENKSIQDIVEEGGWEAFRRCEAASLTTAAQGENRVVATGGGAVLHVDIWPDICENAFVVWLTADVTTIAERLRQDGGVDQSRPSLTELPQDLEIERVLESRRPLYRRFSHVEIDTGCGDIEVIVGNILESYADFIR